MTLSSFETSSDVTIHIYHFTPDESRESPVMVFTHPTGFTSAMYATVASHLRGINIFGIDMRCHGLSAKGKIDSWEDFQRDIEAAFSAIKLKTDQDKFIGVGISSGSSAHILNASKNPELYSALFLCEPILFTPESDLSTRNFLAESARKRRSDFESRLEVYSRFRSKGPISYLTDSSLALYAQYGFKETQNGVTLNCDKHDEEQIYLSGAANGVYEALDKITAPTQIIYGEQSKTISADFANHIASKPQKANAIQMDGVGHFTLFENPVLGARMITDFLSENEIVK